MDRERDRGVADELIEDAREQIGGEESKERPEQDRDRADEGVDKPKD